MWKGSSVSIVSGVCVFRSHLKNFRTILQRASGPKIAVHGKGSIRAAPLAHATAPDGLVVKGHFYLFFRPELRPYGFWISHVVVLTFTSEIRAA
jgi:hypothetical protein